jgi:broad specificity phosphatase PhoE
MTRVKPFEPLCRHPISHRDRSSALSLVSASSGAASGPPGPLRTVSAWRSFFCKTSGVPLLLVRHAHARPRKEWAGEDRLRPLSMHGERQAEGLVAVAGLFLPPTSTLSSPYLRCLQTMEPLGRAHNLSVEANDALSEGQSSAAVSLIRSLAGTNAVLCTHGDVIAEILVTLADEDRVDLGLTPRQAKGSVWALEGKNGFFTSARYFPPVVAESV